MSKRQIQYIHITGDGNIVGDNNQVTVIKKQYFISEYERLHDAYIEPWPVFERVELEYFVGREWLSAEVDAFLRDHDRGYFVLETEAGLGKTTFLAWLVQQRGYIHHFVELAPGLDGVGIGLKNLAAQLALACHLDAYEAEGVLPGAAARPDYLFRLLKQASEQRQQGQKIVLVIDALDEAGTPPGQNVLGLPKVLPEGVFVIVSQRPVHMALHVETLITPRCVFHLTAGDNRNQDDMRCFLEHATAWPGVAQALLDSSHTSEQFAAALLEKCQGMWIYLHYVVHEIERGERSPLDLDALPDGLTQYYIRYWGRWRDQDEGKWYRVYLPKLSTLAATRGAVTVKQLAEWANVDTPMQQLTRLLNERWRPFLAVVGRDQQVRYRFYHATLREFFNGQVGRGKLTVAENAFVDELVQATQEAHRRIAHWYLAAWGGLEENLPDLLANEGDSTLDYGLQYVPFHLIAGGQTASLYRLVESSEWAAAKPLITPKATWYLDDLTLAFDTAIGGDLSSIVDAMAYVLRRELVQQQIANPKPEAVIFLAELGEVNWALELAKVRPLKKRIDILEGIGLSLRDKSPEVALLALEELARTADDSDGLLNQCICRSLAAQRIAQLSLSPRRAQAFVDEVQVLASSLSAPEFASYQINWEIPTTAATGRLDKALELAEELSTLDQCRTLRIAATVLPNGHTQKPILAQRALDLAETIDERGQALEQQVYSLITLAKSQPTDDARVETIDELVSMLDGLEGKVRDAHVLRSHSIDKIAELDLERARTLMEEERWPNTYDSWAAIVSETAKANPDEALALLDERMSNWAIYPYILEDIIERIALYDTGRAEDLIKANAKRLERNLDGAYLALAKGHLARGDRKQAKRVFYQPAFFVNEKHNVHAYAEMQLAMFRNAIDLISLDTSAEWYEGFPVCADCHSDRERKEAREILIQAAAFHERYDLIDKYAHGEREHVMVALTLARKGSVTEAREYIRQHYLGTRSSLGALAYAYIAQHEARCDSAALEKMMQHYEAGPPHHFCYTMVYLPGVLDNLACLDQPLSVITEDMIERIWTVLVHWECPNGANPKFRAGLGGQCGCHSKKERALGQLVGTMARINRMRAQEMLEGLPDSPAKAYALLHIAQIDGVNDVSLVSVQAAICAGFRDAYNRTKAYYELAAALPDEMAEDAEKLVEEAERWLSNSKFTSELKERKAQILIDWFGERPTQEQIDEVISISKSLEAFKHKQAIFTSLFQQAERWNGEAAVDLLRRVLRSTTNSGLTSIQAAIAAAVPLVHSLGNDELLDRLFDSVDWAYQ